MGAEKVDNLVLDYNLYYQILSIFETSDDICLIEQTWKLIGFLCAGIYNPEHVQNFVQDRQVNMI